MENGEDQHIINIERWVCLKSEGIYACLDVIYDNENMVEMRLDHNAMCTFFLFVILWFYCLLFVVIYYLLANIC